MSDTLTATAHTVPGASFTAEQLEARRQTLGASEVPAVLGLDRYKSPLDIYLSKRGLVPPFGGNEHTEWGLRVEPAIRQKVAEVLNVEIELPGTIIRADEPWMSATPDGRFELNGEPRILEIKNKGERQAVYWGEAGTDEVPHDIAAQAHWQLLVSGVGLCTVAVLFGKSDFRMYHLRRDAEIADSILDRCREFWFGRVVAGVEPEISGGEHVARYLKQKFAEHGDSLRDATRAEDGLIAQLRDVRAKGKEIEAEEETIKNRLMAAIGSDAGIQGRAGRVTWKAPNGSQVAWKDVALALKAPTDLIAQFSTPMTRKFLPTFPKD